jgi:hypothetical protein
VREFSEIIGRTLSREEIARDCAARNGLADAWVDYICGKVTRFMKETAVKGIHTGIMVMYNGGRDHGIDIAAIREAVPDCLFRVGQYHFNDAAFEADEGHVGDQKQELNIGVGCAEIVHDGLQMADQVAGVFVFEIRL